jgi:solute:Na+ symporter, SSS family
MLLWFVILYLAISIAVGIVAALRVHNTRDFVEAGRTLPFYVVTATVFATWFGSETVLGISSTFIKDGLGGIVADPFGSSMCLILVGLFFAAKLYRMHLLTIGDYYRVRYNATAELLVSVCIVISYLGWLSAQIVVIGLVFNVVTGGEVSMTTGILIGAAVVLVYTLWGGMYSVAWTNFVQMVVIIIGLFYIAFLVADKAGGVGTVISHAQTAGKLEFWPKLETRDVLAFVGAFITVMFGSIPQQDVFQRVNSSRTEKIAVSGSIVGGSIYFVFAFIPIFIAYSAILIDPKMVGELMAKDHQLILPTLILDHTPLPAQILFFGALLSAVMSTASGTLLAPSVTFTENILKRFLRQDLDDRAFLLTMRIVVAVFAVAVTLFALNTDSTIYEMVVGAYKVTLVAAFVPLVCGLYWKRATTQGALAAILGGLVTWIVLEIASPDGLVPPQLAGVVVSALAMVLGSLTPQVYGARTGGEAQAA